MVAVDKFHVFILLMVTSYIVFDTLLDLCVIKIKNSTDKIMLFHHVVAGSGCLTGLIGGRGLTTMTLFMCLTEASTIPMNRRDMMTKKENDGKMGTCNNLTFLFAFTIFRAVNMPWVIYNYVLAYKLLWND